MSIKKRQNKEEKAPVKRLRRVYHGASMLPDLMEYLKAVAEKRRWSLAETIGYFAELGKPEYERRQRDGAE